MLWAASYSITRIMSSPHRGPGSIDLARLVFGGRQSKHGPDRLEFAEPSGQVDGGAISVRPPANAGGRHQAPAYIVAPHDRQHAGPQAVLQTIWKHSDLGG